MAPDDTGKMITTAREHVNCGFQIVAIRYLRSASLLLLRLAARGLDVPGAAG